MARRGVAVLWFLAAFAAGVDWSVDALDLNATVRSWAARTFADPSAEQVADNTDVASPPSEPMGDDAAITSSSLNAHRSASAEGSVTYASAEPRYGRPVFDPIDLRALADIIEHNGLHEGSSATDRDNGDGVFDPWELGRQTWRNRRLTRLVLGPDDYASYGYEITLLPESVADLTELRVLDLHSNRLSQLPDGIGALAKLTVLRLFNNDLTHLPENIGRLYALRVLVVSRNQLQALPNSLADLRDLEVLHADDNPLEALPDWIGDLPLLHTLNLARAALVGGGLGELPDSLADLATLDSLYLDGNSLYCGDELPEYLVDGSIAAVSGLDAQRCGDTRPGAES